LNVFLNWVMIYGNLGSKALGFEGAAWATLISRSAILVVMLVWLARAKGLAEWIPDNWFKPPVFDEIRRLLSIGMPASVQMLFEVSAFSVAGLWMGLFGPVAMASHQIAITLAGTAFMIPLGLSMALTVRIGTADGAGERDRLRPIMFSGWFLVAGNALLVGTSFMVFGRRIATLFTNDPEVISLSASLLVIVGVFQVVDGLQVASASMLRGLHDARMPALIGLVSYWCIGLPVSAGLAFTFGVGACGVWWGLAVGLAVACMTLGPRLWRQVNRAHLGV
jgi:MATE family multidrug resistance protein